MHTIARQANGIRGRTACRIVGGARQALARSFHRSAVAYRPPEDPAGGAPKANNEGDDGAEENPGQPEMGKAGVDTKKDSIDNLPRSGRRREHTSTLRRTTRGLKSLEIPPFVVPGWFLKENISIWELYMTDRILDEVDRQLQRSSRLLKNYEPPSDSNCPPESNAASISLPVQVIEGEIQAGGLLIDKVTQFLKALHPQHTIPRSESGAESFWPHCYRWARKSGDNDPVRKWDYIRVWKVLQGNSRQLRSKWRSYPLPLDVFAEIFTAFHSDLTLPPPTVDIKDVFRPEIRLFTAQSGGLDFLEVTVQETAHLLKADLIRLDCEDLAQLLGEYLGENVAWAPGPTSLLGYECNTNVETMRSPEKKEEDEEEEADAENDDANSSGAPSNSNKDATQSVIGMVENSPGFLEHQNLIQGISLVNFLGQAAQMSSLPAQARHPKSSGIDLKMDRALEGIIDAAISKRSRRAVSSKDNETGYKGPEFVGAAPGGLVIHISDMRRLNDHSHGRHILNRLRELVKRRWYEGKKIIIVGTTAVDDPERTVWQARFPLVMPGGPGMVESLRHRSIFVPPPPPHAESISNDSKRLRKEINIRRLEQMIRHLSTTTKNTCPIEIGHVTEHVAEQLSVSIWSYTRVRRTATAMLFGFESAELGKIDGESLAQALTMLEESDSVKSLWADEEELSFAESSTILVEKKDQTASAAGSKKIRRDSQMAKIRASCNRYEKKLLGGIIEPDDIHTTFDDVRAPAETIEALKTLTTLSFVRPDAFSYGVLATDKIPGLLMYGPPGTGKTLLAKAVAKESRATVLEVSAAEINDMYVGEGEKNVKAVFSLAAKLSPCVVFIDEADAIFATRGSSSNRRTHREQLNQFLREWDGMENLNAFIMVATNRPFDLDDAVIRRLPRRLLVDLPVEQDRLAILKIHLKDETLEDSVSLTALAKKTPYYSGSDLKNLAVAAALACVREENETAAAHAGPEPYKHLARRVLRQVHFDKAMEEISASISEDMGSLAAIRKFDEKYGDRKGRRRKVAALGFGGTTALERDSEAGRVRQVLVDV